MPQWEYDTEQLARGSRQAATASDAVGRAALALGGAGGGSPFGGVRGAGALHGAVTAARAHHGRAAVVAARGLDETSRHAASATRLGDENTEETTRLAPRAEQAANLAAAM